LDTFPANDIYENTSSLQLNFQESKKVEEEKISSFPNKLDEDASSFKLFTPEISVSDLVKEFNKDSIIDNLNLQEARIDNVDNQLPTLSEELRSFVRESPPPSKLAKGILTGTNLRRPKRH
jgi:hypothetical protein